MGLKEILVHIDHPADSAARLALAAGLARAHGARLSGLLVVRHRYPVEAEVEASRAAFEQEAAAAGVEGLWECVDGSLLDAGMTELVTRRAQCSDLLVVGQGSRDSASVGVHADFPERVVLEAGRPVLVVPYAGSFPTVGERVLVAWKPGPESTRAVNDALPILKLARRVDLFFKPPLGVPEETLGEGSLGIRAHLARHGVESQAHAMVLGYTLVGDLLLNRVFDEGFDLLVMGAHAHGPEGKASLGSVARQMLREMTVPVLMSH
jgi:nucleotide-binding universal stress UspA family protein